MTEDVVHLTPREIAVASLLARRFTCKRIAFELSIGERRVQAIISAVAFKIHVPSGEDDRMAVADWWREQIGDKAA